MAGACGNLFVEGRGPKMTRTGSIDVGGSSAVAPAGLRGDGIRDVYESMLPEALPPLPADDRQMFLLRRHLPSSLDARILDAGCGTGKYAEALVRIGYRGVCGVDLFERLPFPVGFDYRRASIDDTGFPDGTFDFIYSNSVLYYLENPATALREWMRLLKPGGTLFFTAITRYSLHAATRVLKRTFVPGSVPHLKGVRFLPAWTYEHWLGEEGFELVEYGGWRLTNRLGPLLRKVCGKADLFSERTAMGIRCRRLLSVVAYHSFHVARRPLHSKR